MLKVQSCYTYIIFQNRIEYRKMWKGLCLGVPMYYSNQACDKCEINCVAFAQCILPIPKPMLSKSLK